MKGRAGIVSMFSYSSDTVEVFGKTFLIWICKVVVIAGMCFSIKIVPANFSGVWNSVVGCMEV